MKKPFTLITAVLLVVVAVMHVLRYFCGWQMMIHTWTVPMWASWVAAAVLLLLAYMLWCESRCQSTSKDTVCEVKNEDTMSDD